MSIDELISILEKYRGKQVFINDEYGLSNPKVRATKVSALDISYVVEQKQRGKLKIGEVIISISS